ncbi:hypothetical protein ABB55_03290 [Prosthecomicrobium hirschii]|uniref:Uncharacterized protein n=1 Tax=Prosthecodimorpha hirschii TaxID=665126 RepID=A0A0P6VZX0_9HYPH|nr:hypothetical protein [Prosthecomicrobium hirschii]KPL51370.1 hypothetical protein ABB55_03290 [Prosthecomicrobium hirschii]
MQLSSEEIIRQARQAERSARAALVQSKADDIEDGLIPVGEVEETLAAIRAIAAEELDALQARLLEAVGDGADRVALVREQVALILADLSLALDGIVAASIEDTKEGATF